MLCHRVCTGIRDEFRKKKFSQIHYIDLKFLKADLLNCGVIVTIMFYESHSNIQIDVAISNDLQRVLADFHLEFGSSAS